MNMPLIPPPGGMPVATMASMDTGVNNVPSQDIIGVNIDNPMSALSQAANQQVRRVIWSGQYSLNMLKLICIISFLS